MKDYTVVWWPPAERDLTELWMASSDRQRIADAADAIEWQLTHSSGNLGSHLHEGLRELTNTPLCVRFSVDDGDRKITILSVRFVG